MIASADYLPHVDGLRAIAVLAVVLYHVAPRWLPGGLAGVDIFFVISGFVVSASLSRHAGEAPLAYLGGFYRRRLARILPALVLMLIVTGLMNVLLLPKSWMSDAVERTARYAFVGFSNWVLQSQGDTYFAPQAELNPFTHTWSLGVEEQFYLVAPILLFACHSPARSRRIVALGVLAAAGLASMMFCAWATSADPLLAFYSVTSRFWELAAGMGWFLSSRVIGLRVSDRICKGLPLLGAILVALGLAWPPTTFPWPMVVPTVLGTLCLIGIRPMLAAAPSARPVLAQPAAVWIGQRSYSLYLWHWPIVVLAKWTVGLESAQFQLGVVALAVVLAALSYRFVERPLRIVLARRSSASSIRVGRDVCRLDPGSAGCKPVSVSRAALDWTERGDSGSRRLVQRRSNERRREPATAMRCGRRQRCP